MDTATSTREAIYRLRDFVSQRILGQERLVERLLVALLCDGHLLVEGPPGLAKTRAIKILGEGIEGEFHRIQFTPDLMPADLTGTEIYRPQDGSFVFQQGPLFHNLVLADEVNRAPAKVQSALLEAMGERQITIGRVSYHLPELFMVMATQNPLEHEGTYPLPEAQLDRFLLHVNITYPDHEAEKRVLQLAREEAANPVEAGSASTAVLDQEQVFAARREVLATFMSEDVERYLMEIVFATRSPAPYGDDLASWLEYGGSLIRTEATRLAVFFVVMGLVMSGTDNYAHVARPRLAGRPGLRQPRGRSGRRSRRPAPSRDIELRGNSGRRHNRSLRR